MASHSEQQAAKTILVVEDEPDIGAFLTEAILQETPYQIVLVKAAMQAVQIMKDVTPHLLILNYHLPSMNGLELYDRLHSSKALDHIPTLMVSARLPQRELAQRHIVGMSKPLDLDEFLSTIDRLLA